MNYLSAENLSKSWSETPLFTGLSISLQKGQKMALIASNGSGKSTLLKILAGHESPDSGVVSLRNGVTVGYLEQDPYLPPGIPVIDVILDSGHPAAVYLSEYERLIATGHQDESDRMHHLIEKLDALQAWDYEARAREILSRLGIRNVDEPAAHLSGGQKKRVALAKLLLQEPDLLLMDEPTNHLDLDMIEWLERYLVSLNKTMLVVSHDRYFVDGVCDTIAELENGKIYIYKGNYAYYLEKKEEREFREGREIDKARNLMRTELEWMRRQPQARGTKQKARIDSFYDLQDKANSGKTEEKMKITMQMDRLGSKILEFENICKSYGDKTLLKDFSHVFRRGEKVGIVGANGTGKSTLLNMVMGTVKPDQGRIRTGETVVLGYYSQEPARIAPEKRVIDVVKDIAEYVETGNGNYMNVSQFLNHFLFKGSKQHTLVSKLSGGELKRLHLLTILLRNPNFLILDEPTNDLDITTLNILEDFLSGYQGCMLLVTHDRYFMDRLVDHVFVLDGSGIVKDIHGNYSAYRQLDKSGGSASKSTAGNEPAARPAKERKQKLSYKEQKEFESLEAEISRLESRKAELELILSGNASGQDEITKASQEYSEADKQIAIKTDRWLELAARAEG